MWSHPLEAQHEASSVAGNERREQSPLVLALSGVHYSWPGRGEGLAIPEFRLARGEHCFLYGPSGSGKSTLLALLAGLVRPRHGRIELLGHDLGADGRRRRDRFRADHLGIIFQQFNLVPYLSALDNVLLPCRFSAHRRARVGPGLRRAAGRILASLDIPDSLFNARVGQLSVGQQQRVAAARALLGDPELILADEPTSALDAANRDRFLELLLDQAQRHHSTVLFVSHDQSLAGHFERVQSIEPWREAQS